MKPHTTNQSGDAGKPITSLISKSAKAMEKLKPGTWQHQMLQGCAN